MNTSANVTETMQHTLDATRTSLRDGTRRIRATARHAAVGTNEFVRSNPWSAIGLASAAAAIAVLLGTRMHR